MAAQCDALLVMMYWKAWDMRPPLQPSLPSGPEQSTRFCSDSDTRLPVASACWPSVEPVVENDLHQ